MISRLVFRISAVPKGNGTTKIQKKKTSKTTYMQKMNESQISFGNLINDKKN